MSPLQGVRGQGSGVKGPKIAETPIRDFKDLLVWQKAISLAVETYHITKRLPKEEQFGLTAQIRRAAVSVSSNIAEGHARQGREFAYFLSIARGSLAELESQLSLTFEIGLLSSDETRGVFDNIQEIRRMLIGLTKRLEESALAPTSRRSDPSPLTPHP